MHRNWLSEDRKECFRCREQHVQSCGGERKHGTEIIVG